jgi:hypothetical protein
MESCGNGYILEDDCYYTESRYHKVYLIGLYNVSRVGSTAVFRWLVVILLIDFYSFYLTLVATVGIKHGSY